jgi:hypothetical protein
MGGSSGDSSSAPLNATQRSDLYNSALSDIGGTGSSIMPQGYTAPTYASARSPQMIQGGNLNTMQKQMTAGYTAPLDSAKATDLKNYNSDAAKRGVWSSGLALQGENDINKAYAPQYANAGAQATNATMGIENSQLQAANSLNQQNAGAQNTFNLANAQQGYQSNWAPLNYLQGIWNGTGGTIGSGSNMSMNF